MAEKYDDDVIVPCRDCKRGYEPARDTGRRNGAKLNISTGGRLGCLGKAVELESDMHLLPSRLCLSSQTFGL